MTTTPDAIGAAAALPAPRPLCHTFASLAVRTYQWLTGSRIPHMVPFETSITDANLYELWLNHQREVQIWRYSGPREKRTGADWEWWIGGGGHWLGARVQAKKLDDAGRQYTTLWKTDGGVRQIDTLIGAARAAALPALYCFYNGAAGTPAGWRSQCANPVPEELFGCAVADAVAVSRGSDRIEDVSPISIPWSDLVCCDHDLPLGVRAADVVSRLTGQDHSARKTLPTYVRGAVLNELGGNDEHLRTLAGILLIEQQEA
jgi:hypothetical protein